MRWCRPAESIGLRPALEVADIFRRHGPAYVQAHDGKIGRAERRVMSAIQLCRSSALGGHVEGCRSCGTLRIAYDSCRNRHCPKCQGAIASVWLEARAGGPLPVPYFHVVFTMPAEIAAIAFQNKEVVYGILFRTAAETLRIIAADPRHLGAGIGLIAVLHSWGQTLSYHPHPHCIVPGGGPSPDDTRWIACRPGVLLPVRVLSRLFRRLCLQALRAAFKAGQLDVFGDIADLVEPPSLARQMEAAGRRDRVVYVKPPFGGPEQVLAYLSRYTHRVAIANSRLVIMEDGKVTFRWRDYRRGRRPRAMTLDAGDFIRRVLLHTRPDGFHRMRQFGFLANGQRAARLAACRALLAARVPKAETGADPAAKLAPAPHPCPCCGRPMVKIAVWYHGQAPPCILERQPMNVYSRRKAHDRKPASSRAGQAVCGVAPRSWWLRPVHEALNRQTGPLHRYPVIPGGQDWPRRLPSSASSPMSALAPTTPGQRLGHNPHNATSARSLVQSGFNEVAGRPAGAATSLNPPDSHM